MKTQGSASSRRQLQAGHARGASQRGPRRWAAFTLEELLAVIVVLGLLVTVQFSALARAKGQNRITQCASNLRQFTQASFVLAQENEDKLPNNDAGYWAWDLAWETGTSLTNSGADWKAFYCPGTAPRFSATDNFALYTYGPPGSYRVLGYATTFPNNHSVSSSNLNTSLTPPPVLVAPGVYLKPLPSKRVLLADGTISAAGQYTYSQRLTYNWTSILGGYPVRYISAHLNGTIPSGGNQSMLDGHVEWRKFDDMQCRVPGNGAPGFWW